MARWLFLGGHVAPLYALSRCSGSIVEVGGKVHEIALTGDVVVYMPNEAVNYDTQGKATVTYPVDAPVIG